MNPPAKRKRVRVQKWPNLIRSERRICLTRIRWETGVTGVRPGKDSKDSMGHSNKVSISICFVPRDLWIGAFWKTGVHEALTMWICLIPCFPIRIAHHKSWGGIFP